MCFVYIFFEGTVSTIVNQFLKQQQPKFTISPH